MSSIYRKTKKIIVHKCKDFIPDDAEKNKSFIDDEGKLFCISKKTINGVIYYYQQYSRQIEGKGSRPIQVLLGREDPASGLIRKAHVPLSVKVAFPVKKDLSYGSSFVLEKITERLKIKSALKAAFGGDSNDILALSFAIACQDSRLYMLQQWFDTNFCKYSSRNLSSGRISEFLPKISFEKRNVFFTEWIKIANENEYLAYDITSISSYAKNIDSVEFGYNRDCENLPQINLGLLYGENSRIPLYYRMFDGGVKDVNTIDNLLVALSSYNIGKIKFVMDKGGYSRENVDIMCEKGHIFSISVPFNNNWSRGIVEKNCDIKDHSYYSATHLRYCKSVEADYYGRKLRAFIYFDPKEEAEQVMAIEARVHEGKALLGGLKEKQESVEGKKYSKSQVDNIINKHEALFDIEKVPIGNKRAKDSLYTINYSLNKGRYQSATSTSGYMVVISNDYEKTSEEILTIYREKDVAEKAFDDAKNLLDADRLHIHTREAAEGKLFLIFLSLIYVAYIRKAARVSKLNLDLTYSEIIGELAKIRVYTYENEQSSMLKLNPKQRKILKAFDLNEEDLRSVLKGNEMVSTINCQ
jgi:transposase